MRDSVIQRGSERGWTGDGGCADDVGWVTDSQLAVLLRQAQWALDEAARDFPAGRVTPQRRSELSGTLEALAAIVRASAPDGVR